MKKVLIVDDSHFFIVALRDLLAEEGFLLSTAYSAEEAIDLLNDIECPSNENSEPFDLLITDLVMPGLSGYDLAQFVRQKNKRSKFIPVIMLTEKDITKEEARKYGCSAYIPKSNITKVVSMARILISRFD